jgi:hypothetical protein
MRGMYSLKGVIPHGATVASSCEFVSKVCGREKGIKRKPATHLRKGAPNP